MAKYSRKSQSKVKRAMHEMKEGKLKSGRSGKKVKNRKQAIAIGLSEARAAGAKVPAKKGAKKKKRQKIGEEIISTEKNYRDKEKSRSPGEKRKSRKKRKNRKKIRLKKSSS